MIVLDEKKLSFLLIILFFAIVFLIIRAVFRFVKWVLRSIWGLLTGKRYRGNPLESDDWLVRAQARQEIRMNNSLPQVLHSEMKKENLFEKLFKKKKVTKPKQKETDKKNEKFTHNPDWRWDEETQLWRHKSTWNKK